MFSSSAARTARTPSVGRGTPPRRRSTTRPITSSWPHLHRATRKGVLLDDDGDAASTSAVILWYSVMVNFVYMLYFISGRLGDED